MADVVVTAIDYSGAKEIRFAPGPNAHAGRVTNNGEPGFTVPTTTLAEQLLKLPKNKFILICDIE